MALTADGHVVEAMLTPGNAADISVADELTEDVYGCAIAEDMGYDSDAHRAVLRSRNCTPVIPGRRNRKIEIIYDKQIYKLRKRIEIYFGKLKENKRVALRFDKEDDSFLSFIALAAIKILLKIIIS